MRSASRSALSTRSVTSSRFPMGVGQTTRRPATVTSASADRLELARDLERQRRGAEHAALVAEAGDDDPHLVARGHERARRDDRPRRREAQRARPATTPPAAAGGRRPAATSPPPTTTPSGLKTLMSPVRPTPRRRPSTAT